MAGFPTLPKRLKSTMHYSLQLAGCILPHRKVNLERKASPLSIAVSLGNMTCLHGAGFSLWLALNIGLGQTCWAGDSAYMAGAGWQAASLTFLSLSRS